MTAQVRCISDSPIAVLFIDCVCLTNLTSHRTLGLLTGRPRDQLSEEHWKHRWPHPPHGRKLRTEDTARLPPTGLCPPAIIHTPARICTPTSLCRATRLCTPASLHTPAGVRTRSSSSLHTPTRIRSAASLSRPSELYTPTRLCSPTGSAYRRLGTTSTEILKCSFKTCFSHL